MQSVTYKSYKSQICDVLQLQVQVTNLLAANRTGGQVRTDLSTFPTPEFARVSLKMG